MLIIVPSSAVNRARATVLRRVHNDGPISLHEIAEKSRRTPPWLLRVVLAQLVAERSVGRLMMLPGVRKRGRPCVRYIAAPPK